MCTLSFLTNLQISKRNHQVTGIGPFEEPLEHLLCRFLREGEGEDLTRRSPLVEEVKDLLGDDPGLPRAGSGGEERGRVVTW